MQDNKYAPPDANLDPLEIARPRPIPVYLIAVLCVIQVVGVTVAVVSGWQQISQMLDIGVQTPMAFWGGFLFPLLYVIAGALLFFMRRAAAYAFTIYLLWGAGKFLLHHRATPTILDMVATTCIVAYCWHLHRTGRLN